MTAERKTASTKGAAPRREGKQADVPFAKLTQISPREIFLCLRERALVAAAIALVVCGLLGAWLLSQPKLYQAQARLLFDRKERVIDMAQVVDQSVSGGRNDAMLDTQLQQLVGPDMVKRVVASLSESEKQRIYQPYAKEDRDVSDSRRLDAAVRGIVAANIGARRQGNTFFIGVRMNHRDPQMAALVATRFAQQFIIYQLERNTSANNSAIAFLRAQTEELKAKAEASENALQQYRESTGMVSLDESRNIVVDRMKTLSSSATSARISRLAIEARLMQAEDILNGSADPLELATIAEFSSLANIQNQIDELRTKRVIMAERYGPKHPSMVDNNKSLDALLKLRGELITTAMANLRNAQSQSLKQEQQLLAELAKAEEESLRLDQMSIRFNVLRREAETNRTTYSQLLNRLNQTTITAQLESSTLRLSDEANVPAVPIAPNTKRIITVLVLLGLGIFVSYPFAMELIFNRVRDWADVESYLKLPLLGEVPGLKKMNDSVRPHLLTRSEDEQAQEAIRSLYSQLKLTSKIDLPKSILVTSTVPSEGKSFVASNLAEAFATHGVKTLLMDTDLRRPTQHRAFGLPNDAGLLKWVAAKLPVPSKPSEEPLLGITLGSPNLYLLRTGGMTRQSTQVLDSPIIADLLKALQAEFDLIVIDTPPAGVFPDAMTMSEFAAEVIYVVRHNHVARPAVRRVIERLSGTGIEQAGIVLNMMPSGRTNAAYYSNYGHYGSKYYSNYEKKSGA